MDPLSQRLMMGAAGSGGPPVYIEDVFSTWLYTGNGSTQTITNGIDLATKGGLVWIKSRSAEQAPKLWDTLRGINQTLNTTVTAGNDFEPGSLTSFNATGFSLGSSYSQNTNNTTYAAWTFRRQPKFFDIVTYTGDGNTNRAVTHSLTSIPGFIIIKATSTTSNWAVYHRGNGSQFLTQGQLNTTATISDMSGLGWSAPTSTEFFPQFIRDSSGNTSNQNGVTYVAYLFAHDAGGFGASGTDNVISCGSFTTDGSGNATVNLGYEPQWLLTKQTNASNSWYLEDTMRGMSLTRYSILVPNTTAAEANAAVPLSSPTATGFTTANQNPSSTFIYIAIRRGPMRTPTSGTSVFTPQSPNSSGSFPAVVTNFPVDLGIVKTNKTALSNWFTSSRLQGQMYMFTNTTAAEASDTSFQWDSNTGWLALSGANLASWNFRRAPGFFDIVCYTGDGTFSRNVNHNLGVVPEMIIVKSRSNGTTNWVTGVFANGTQLNLWLNSTAADGSASSGGITYTQFSTSTTFRLSAIGGVVTDTNSSNARYVAYLFASCPGVSKVGTYTGTGSTVQVNCGFTAGARFVLIKRTDATGDWYVWDSARGIIAGDDPYLALNSTAAEVTSTDWVDPISSGFEVSNAGSNLVNVNGATYLFLAIA